jgi:asparagine synthase (glutamine-hydrolysing)
MGGEVRVMADTLYLFRSTMAWGLEARVPFLDKAFLEVAMNIDAKDKMFHKGADQEVDHDGCPKMEKVGRARRLQ